MNWTTILAILGKFHIAQAGHPVEILAKLKRILKDRQVSLDEVSIAIGVSPVNISRICTGKIRLVRFTTTNAICKYLERDYGDLFCYIPEDRIKDDDVVCYRESEEYDYFEWLLFSAFNGGK